MMVKLIRPLGEAAYTGEKTGTVRGGGDCSLPWARKE